MTKPLQVSPASRIPAKTVSKDSVQLVADCVRVRMTEMVVAANLNEPIDMVHNIDRAVNSLLSLKCRLEADMAIGLAFVQSSQPKEN